MTIFFKLPPNSGHLSITDNFFKTRKCPLLRVFTVVGMRNFQDTFETRKQSFISAFSICMTVPLKFENGQRKYSEKPLPN